MAQTLAAVGGASDIPIRKILVADDERHILRLLQVNFERAGYQVVCASSGHEAFDAIVTEWPDAVILDTSVPEPNGYEILRRIRLEPSLSHLRVVLFVENNSEAERQKAWQAGADYVITKPFNPIELLSMIPRH